MNSVTGGTTSTTERAPLTRTRIIETALAYVDTHGLAALSMHKLGAELGVKAMSLYNHVGSKDEVLDGIVELLWTQTQQACPEPADWQSGVTGYATALRQLVLRHPQAAPLVLGRPVMPEPALRLVRAHLAAAAAGGPPPEQAVAVLRTITAYALGHALVELAWFRVSTPECGPTGRELVPAGVPEELAAVADVFCTCYDGAGQFQLGLDLMLRGLEPDPPAA